MEAKLTLAVPTFNRRDAIVENTRRALDGIQSLPVDYLVIDNASDDQTYDALIGEFGENKQARFLKNDSNIGYFGNFLKLFESCKTEYILISSDEDEFFAENIDKLIRCLDDLQPAMCSCQVYLDQGQGQQLYRGKSNRATISPEDFYRSSHYMSGLVFNVKKLQSTLEFIKSVEENWMVNIYPQVIMAVSVIAMREVAIWLDFPLTVKRYKLDSKIFDSEGGKYYYLESKMKQARDFHKVLDVMKDFEKNNSSDIEKIRKESFLSFFSVIRHALSKEKDQEFLKEFDRTAKRFAIKSIIRKPLAIMRRAKLELFHKSGRNI